MPLPATITTVTLEGEFLGPDGTPQTGLIELELLSEWSVPASDVVVVRRLVKGIIQTDGTFSIPGIAVNNDPQASGVSQYRLTAKFDDGVPAIVKVVEIPDGATGVVQYENLVAVPVTPPPADATIYATIDYVNQKFSATGGVPGYTHTQAIASSVWDIVHDLGWDPAGVQVFDDTGAEIDGGVVTYLVPGSVLRIAFDISFAGTARLT